MILDIDYIKRISEPVIAGFEAVETKTWDRTALLIELIGEIGSLAHEIQLWEGYKKRKNKKDPSGKLRDECSDILFILIRMGRKENVILPDKIELEEIKPERIASLVLEMITGIARLINEDSGVVISGEMKNLMIKLAQIAFSVNIDLTKAFELEMKIAMQCFIATGNNWPNLQLFYHPLETVKFIRLRSKRKSKR